MNIYVGNLSYEVKEIELKEMFEEFGSVSSAKLITDKYTGRSKGFCFVEMDNDDEARKAMEALDGKVLQGRPLAVKEANPRSY